jgi:hypothetical protein
VSTEADTGFGERADALVDRIAPILAGSDAELQGAVLADLTAIWIAGHRTPGDRADGDCMRESLMHMHVRHVRELVCMYLGGVDG